MVDGLYQVTSGYFCAGIVVKGGHITEAAPILKWTIGKRLVSFEVTAKLKSWTLIKVSQDYGRK